MFYLYFCEKVKLRDYDWNNPDLQDKPCNSQTVFLAQKFLFHLHEEYYRYMYILYKINI